MTYRKWLAVAGGLFILGIILGLVTPLEAIEPFLEESLNELVDIASMYQPFSIRTAFGILGQNILVLVLSTALSPFLLLPPVLILLVNSWLITFVTVALAEQEMLGLIIWGIIPHGIFEIPAFIMGEAAALAIGFTFIRAFLKTEYRTTLFPDLRKNLNYLGIALTLLVPAALIETFITPLLLAHYE